MARITGILHEDQYKFIIIFRSFLLRITDISDKVLDKIKSKQSLCSVRFFENLAVYGIM
jgi:hypothetical protein